jgi:hypothetical protein
MATTRPPRALPRQEGLRPADPERIGLRQRHRHAGRAQQGRPVDCRHRRRHVRLHQHPGGADAAPGDGRGRRIDISMLEAMAEWMGYPLYYAFEGARRPRAAGASARHHLPLRPLPAGRRQDGDAGPAERTRVAGLLHQVLLQPALATDERFAGNAKRSAHRDALRAIIVEAFATLTAAAGGQRLEDAQIANAQVRDMAGLWAHPQLAARQRWRQVDTPAGEVPTLLPPGNRAAGRHRGWTPCPRWASTPTPSWPSWAWTRRDRSAARGRGHLTPSLPIPSAHPPWPPRSSIPHLPGHLQQRRDAPGVERREPHRRSTWTSNVRWPWCKAGWA